MFTSHWNAQNDFKMFLNSCWREIEGNFHFVSFKVVKTLSANSIETRGGKYFSLGVCTFRQNETAARHAKRLAKNEIIKSSITFYGIFIQLEFANRCAMLWLPVGDVDMLMFAFSLRCCCWLLSGELFWHFAFFRTVCRWRRVKESKKKKDKEFPSRLMIDKQFSHSFESPFCLRTLGLGDLRWQWRKGYGTRLQRDDWKETHALCLFQIPTNCWSNVLDMENIYKVISKGNFFGNR